MSEKTHNTVDTLNWAMVAGRGDRVAIMGDVRTPFSRAQAFCLAAWLLAMSDPGGEHEDFADYLAAIEST